MQKRIAIPVVVVAFLSFVGLVGCEPESDNALKPSKTKQALLASDLALLDKQDGSTVSLDTTKEVAGVDANLNGIRDDVEYYIEALHATDSEKKALRFNAKALQGTLTLDASKPKDAIKINNKMDRAIQCVVASYNDYDKALVHSKLLETVTMNTKERLNKQAEFRRKLAQIPKAKRSDSDILLSKIDACRED